MSASRRESINQVEQVTENSSDNPTSNIENQQTTSSRTQRQLECHFTKIKSKITTTDPNNGIQNQNRTGFPVPPLSWVANRKARFVEIASEVASEPGSEDVEEDENSSSEEDEEEITKTGRGAVVSDDEDKDPTYQPSEGSYSEDDQFKVYESADDDSDGDESEDVESEENESEENESTDNEPEVNLRTQSKDGSRESSRILATRNLEGIPRSSIWYTPRPRRTRRLLSAPKTSSLNEICQRKFVRFAAENAGKILGEENADRLKEETEIKYEGKINKDPSYVRRVKLEYLGTAVLESMDGDKAMEWVPKLVNFTISWSQEHYTLEVATTFAYIFGRFVARWLQKSLFVSPEVIAMIRTACTRIIPSIAATNYPLDKNKNKNEKWTLPETLILGMAWGMLRNWSTVGGYFPQRMLTDVKGHFYSNLGHKFGRTRGSDGRRVKGVVESLKEMRGWKDVEEEYARYCMQDDPEPYFENLARKKEEDEKKKNGEKDGGKKRMLERIKKDLGHHLTKEEMEMIVNHRLQAGGA